MLRTSFRIRGMCCGEEVAVLRREIGPLVGGDLSLSFDLLESKMTVISMGPGAPDAEAIRSAVARTGMEAIPWEDACRSGVCPLEEGLWQRHGRLVLCAVSGLLMLAGILAHAVHEGSLLRALREDPGTVASFPPVVLILYAGAILSGAWYILPKALFAILRLRPDMNLLMSVAAAGAVGIGQWLEAASVTFLFSLALVLESWSVGRARQAIKALVDISPTRARFICPHDGDIEEKPVEDVPVGVAVLVRPGEKIPLDGVITKGETSVNQSPLTGESMPVPKRPGEEVFAGTINGEGSIEFRSTRPADDTTLARTIRLVEEAQARRAPLEQWVEKFARYYTPAMMGLAALLAVVPPLVLGGGWAHWFYQGLVLLVIACPCSLVISTPVSIVAGLTAAARQGVLIKGGAFLEAPAQLKALAFDKTGTLTLGHPAVQDVIPMNGHSVEELLALASAMETHSTHPLARAIVRHAASLGLEVPVAESFTVLPGQGAQGVIGGKTYWIGNHRLMEKWEHKNPGIHDIATRMEDAGHSLVVMWCDDHVCGIMSIADQVRLEARDTVAELKKLGVERVDMLTGDNRRTAEELAALVEVDGFGAEMLPEDKVNRIKELRETYGTVGMVGDGVNDAPAMAEATVSIAMGAMGSDAAIETADIALMADDISRLPWLIRHSRKTVGIIRQNIVFSVGVKAVFIGLTMMGAATLWMAIAADMGASLLVIFNGLRLLRGASA